MLFEIKVMYVVKFWINMRIDGSKWSLPLNHVNQHRVVKL